MQNDDARSVSSPPPGDDPVRALGADVIASLVANHREFLSFLERRVGSRELAEDILQEAFARGINRVETLRSDESAAAWFYRTLRNAVIDRHRRRATEERALFAFASELEANEAPKADLHSAVCQCVRRLAETLKPEYAEALDRIEVHGLSVKAFAEERGISSSNAAVRVFRAREALRRQVVASCGTCADHGCLDCSCAAAEKRGEHGHHGCS